MKEYSYQIFVPGGNDTALVFGLENNLQIRKIINDCIMDKFPNVEQVGFLSTDFTNPQLIMAGGEFCGNATRAAAWYYLNGFPGELSLKVSGVNGTLRAGINSEYEAWAQMPIKNDLDSIKEIESGFFGVEMEGITHIVVMPKESEMYLKSGYDLKSSGKSILSHHNLLNHPAAGVVFLESVENVFKIHPCVFVSSINTMFYETACGSGTIAVGLVIASMKRENIEISLVQPSLREIKAIINCQGSTVTEAVISGRIETNNTIYRG